MALACLAAINKSQTITLTLKRFEDYIVTNIKINLEYYYMQKNFHWIDSYNTVLKYTDYWEQNNTNFICLILSKTEYSNFKYGKNLKKADLIYINSSSTNTNKISVFLSPNEKYYLIIYNPNFATSASFKLINN